MASIEVDSEKLNNVDWGNGGSRRTGFQVGISINGVGGSIKLSYEELKILRLLLERPIDGIIPMHDDNKGLQLLHAFIKSMEGYASKGGR